MTSTSMPAAFIGHGSPMNALEHNRHTDAWHAFAQPIPKPRAIVAISAHWYINATAVTAMERPRTIHDFYGFPDELFAFEYAAAGAPDVASEIAEVVKPTWVGMDNDSWGLDHGTWSVLAHMFPEANVPVIQLSINGNESFDYHVALGAALAPLRDQAILFIGSGNVVHNLRRIDWSKPEGGFDWAHRFDDAARELMTNSPGDIAQLGEHPDYQLASPTPDHFLPLLYIAGLAAAADTTADMFVGGCAMGSLSMASYQIPALKSR